MKTVGDWKVNEAWLQQVYKHVYVWIKQIYSVCNSLNANMQLLIQCILIVAKPLLTKVYVNIMFKMLAPHIVWSVGQTKHS